HIPDNFPFEQDDEENLLLPVSIPVAYQKLIYSDSICK
ncbi:unnamed protein product, partial [marine sediment metagenome]